MYRGMWKNETVAIKRMLFDRKQADAAQHGESCLGMVDMVPADGCGRADIGMLDARYRDNELTQPVIRAFRFIGSPLRLNLDRALKGDAI